MIVVVVQAYVIAKTFLKCAESRKGQNLQELSSFLACLAAAAVSRAGLQVRHMYNTKFTKSAGKLVPCFPTTE